MSELILLHPEKLERVLSRNGYCFKTLTITVEGPYTTYDAALNYVDIPHHDHIHDVMDDRDLAVDDYICSKLRFQKIFPFLKVPLLVIGYKYAKHSYCHYFNWMGIHVINDVNISSDNSNLSINLFRASSALLEPRIMAITSSILSEAIINPSKI